MRGLTVEDLREFDRKTRAEARKEGYDVPSTRYSPDESDYCSTATTIRDFWRDFTTPTREIPQHRIFTGLRENSRPPWEK